MNWRATGITLVLLAFVIGAVGLMAGQFVKASTEQQAKWALDCFNTGGFDGCAEQRENEASVREWSDNGFYLAIGACLVGMMGAGLWIGSISQMVDASETTSTVQDDQDDKFNEDQLAEAEAIERELSLRGVRLE